MKRILSLFAALLLAGIASAQPLQGGQLWARYFYTGQLAVGKNLAGIVNPNSYPPACAWLELGQDNTTKGLLLPRVTSTSVIASPSPGLLVYSYADTALMTFDGTGWRKAGGGAAGGGVAYDTTGKGLASRAYVGQQIAAIPIPSWSQIPGKPSAFAPSAHTHLPGDILAGGATAGQVLTWNGSAWAPATPATSGGGSSYIAGAGIAIVSNTISVASLPLQALINALQALPGYGANKVLSSTDTGIIWAASASSTPAVNAVTLDATGDWYTANLTNNGASSYQLYRSVTSNPSDATKVYEGPTPSMPFVPVLAGRANYFWWKTVSAGVTSGFTASANVTPPANVDSLHIFTIGDSNTEAQIVDSNFTTLLSYAGFDAQNRGASGTGVNYWKDALAPRVGSFTHVAGQRYAASVMLGTNDIGPTAYAGPYTPEEEFPKLSALSKH